MNIFHTCFKCKTSLYWNNKDKTQKKTGSWYEVYSNALHDENICELKREDRIRDSDYTRGYRLQQDYQERY